MSIEINENMIKLSIAFNNLENDDGIHDIVHGLFAKKYYLVFLIKYEKNSFFDIDELHQYIRESFSCKDCDYYFLDAVDYTIVVASTDYSNEALATAMEKTAKEIGPKSMSVCWERKVSTDWNKLGIMIGKVINLSKDNKQADSNHFEMFHSKESTIVDPVEIRSILNYYELGNFEKISSIIDKKVEEIRKNDKEVNSAIAPSSIKRFFVELITYSIHLAYDYGVDVDKVMNYEDPYQIIFSMDDTPVIKEWFMNSCRKLYDECQNIIRNDKSSLSEGIEQYIENNYSNDNLSVSEIADAFNLTASYISNCYSLDKNQTIISYLKSIRLKKACELLRKTAMTLQEICKKTGFSSINYFCTCFKKEYGTTPSDYRKNMQ